MFVITHQIVKFNIDKLMNSQGFWIRTSCCLNKSVNINDKFIVKLWFKEIRFKFKLKNKNIKKC